jgi:hypothetical protein
MNRIMERIGCSTCGKSYAWKAQYAGRSVRCKCGQAIRVPLVPAPAPATPNGAESVTDEFERALAAGAYELAGPAGFGSGIASESDVPHAAVVAPAFVPPRPALARRAIRPTPAEVENEVASESRFKDLLLALILKMFGLGALPKSGTRSNASVTSPTDTARALVAGGNLATDKSAAADIDAQAEQLIRGTRTFEATKWCRPESPSHVGAKVDRETMLALASRYYGVGSRKVWAADIKRIDNKDVCAKLIVYMPFQPEARAAVLSVVDEFKGESRLTQKMGRTYLIVSMN